MSTNTNGDVPSTPDSTEKEESARGSRSSRPSFSDVLGVIIFFAAWIIFGIVIFNHLAGSGTSIVLAALAAFIGGFIAAVITYIVGMSGATL